MSAPYHLLLLPNAFADSAAYKIIQKSAGELYQQARSRHDYEVMERLEKHFNFEIFCHFLDTNNRNLPLGLTANVYDVYLQLEKSHDTVRIEKLINLLPYEMVSAASKHCNIALESKILSQHHYTVFKRAILQSYKTMIAKILKNTLYAKQIFDKALAEDDTLVLSYLMSHHLDSTERVRLYKHAQNTANHELLTTLLDENACDIWDGLTADKDKADFEQQYYIQIFLSALHQNNQSIATQMLHKYAYEVYSDCVKTKNLTAQTHLEQDHHTAYLILESAMTCGDTEIAQTIFPSTIDAFTNFQPENQIQIYNWAKELNNQTILTQLTDNYACNIWSCLDSTPDQQTFEHKYCTHIYLSASRQRKSSIESYIVDKYAYKIYSYCVKTNNASEQSALEQNRYTAYLILESAITCGDTEIARTIFPSIIDAFTKFHSENQVQIYKWTKQFNNQNILTQLTDNYACNIWTGMISINDTDTDNFEQQYCIQIYLSASAQQYKECADKILALHPFDIYAHCVRTKNTTEQAYIERIPQIPYYIVKAAIENGHADDIIQEISAYANQIYKDAIHHGDKTVAAKINKIKSSNVVIAKPTTNTQRTPTSVQTTKSGPRRMVFDGWLSHGVKSKGSNGTGNQSDSSFHENN
ncbi:MAG: hypothetical protein IKW09_02180 [Alphaproteobacteria bacterium]|nr:hypothetical protein [Alphaproteobacteria bacterium]